MRSGAPLLGLAKYILLKYIKVKLLLCKLSLKRGFKFSIVMYG